METSETPLQEVGEFGLIGRLNDILGPSEDTDLVKGIGDDAAVYAVGGGMVNVVTSDALIEGVHFSRSFMPMENLGFKAISVNVSDVVAMNATPRYVTMTLGIPNQVTVEEIEALYRGVRAACQTFGCTMVGGDITAAGRLMLSVTAIGSAKESDVAYRSGAREGDVLCVSGELGGAYAGLRVLLRATQEMQDEFGVATPELEPYLHVIERHLTPRARLDMIREWEARGVRPTSLIDISDGLASEIHHICRQSGVGAVLNAERLPTHVETRAVAEEFAEDLDTYALLGGEEYELLFTVTPEDLDKLDPNTYHAIGIIDDAARGVQVHTANGVVNLQADGFEHF